MALRNEPSVTKEEAKKIADNYTYRKADRKNALHGLASSLRPGNGIVGRTGAILLWSGVIAAAGLASSYLVMSPLPGLVAAGAIVGFGAALRDSSDSIAAKTAFPNALISLGLGSLGTVAVTAAGVSSMLPFAMSAIGATMFATSYCYHRIKIR
ncbi:MAG: hypothetical protein IKD08_01150 [Alphaproteobacteria bacterium]|nr:hypothetical protein [Alphaproteobacteria bacterium]